jgi:tetratricopeptide (TPR) repeat protein
LVKKLAMSRPRILGLLLALATLLAYLPATRNGFINYDDDLYVTQNPMVQKGLTWDGIKWAFGKINVSNWHPLTWLSHMTDCELFRLNAGGHHFDSVLIHAANAVLLFALLLRMTGALWPGVFIAALFAWHPLHVESVAWVSERKDVLSTFFALLAMLGYVRYVEASKAQSSKSKGYFMWSLVTFALGLMAKPMLVTLPFVLLLLDYWPLRRISNFKFQISNSKYALPPPVPAANFQPSTFNFLLFEKWPFFLLAAIACVITIIAQQDAAMVPLHQVPLELRLENVITAYGDYLWKMIWPAHLSVFYPLPKHIPLGEVILATTVLAAISILAWIGRRRRSYLLVGWLWYLGTLVPVIGLVQVGDQAMADRYTYFPLIGIFLAATFLIKDFAEQKYVSPRWLGLLAGVVLALCLLVTEKQLAYWRNSQTLFTHALAVTRDNALAHLNLGAAFQEQNRPTEALAEYQEVLRLSPGREEAYNNIGRILNDQGKPSAALEYCQAALQLNPRSPAQHDSLGIVLAELGRADEALRQFDEALRLDPNYAPAYFQKGRLLLRQNHDLEAVKQLNQALQIDPDNFQMLIYTARVLAADENPPVRNDVQALAYVGRAARLTGTAQPVMLDTLAMTMAEAGRFDEAMTNEQQAVALARAGGQPEDAATMQRRLELYQKHQPWRESFRQ